MISFDIDYIENAAHYSPKKHGAYSMFFKLNEEIGIKACFSEDIRDENYETQNMASKFNLGPLTYGKIEFNYLGEKWYGYFTEIVELITSDVFQQNTWNIDKLTNDLEEKIGFVFEDSHYNNIGRKNGEFVCIDFDSLETLNNIGFMYEDFFEDNDVEVQEV